jgi:hypothetical protein
MESLVPVRSFIVVFGGFAAEHDNETSDRFLINLLLYAEKWGLPTFRRLQYLGVGSPLGPDFNTKFIQMQGLGGEHSTNKL